MSSALGDWLKTTTHMSKASSISFSEVINLADWGGLVAEIEQVSKSAGSSSASGESEEQEQSDDDRGGGADHRQGPPYP
jgi:hypothetical protein